ncbi:hypothetical protein LQF12_04290 [Ruania suaedae]|uniref:hypothetical protein n=1 Tax=Ruania suaedae TaxID=2897774 RepID=UPI001E460CF2|nr:hypothetical protein [Ruania suaedae]UFU03834.1 hypothetical protein LQF12_04290 [Ruania suaedae]
MSSEESAMLTVLFLAVLVGLHYWSRTTDFRRRGSRDARASEPSPHREGAEPPPPADGRHDG